MARKRGEAVAPGGVVAPERRLDKVLELIKKSERRLEELKASYEAERQRVLDRIAALKKEQAEVERAIQDRIEERYRRTLVRSAGSLLDSGIPPEILQNPEVVSMLRRYAEDVVGKAGGGTRDGAGGPAAGDGGGAGAEHGAGGGEPGGSEDAAPARPAEAAPDSDVEEAGPSGRRRLFGGRKAG